jgi:hypothetical protein
MAHLNQLLDEALNETFPASDPIAIAVEYESAEEVGFYNAIESRSGVRRHPRGGRTSR